MPIVNSTWQALFHGLVMFKSGV